MMKMATIQPRNGTESSDHPGERQPAEDDRRLQGVEAHELVRFEHEQHDARDPADGIGERGGDVGIEPPHGRAEARRATGATSSAIRGSAPRRTVRWRARTSRAPRCAAAPRTRRCRAPCRTAARTGWERPAPAWRAGRSARRRFSALPAHAFAAPAASSSTAQIEEGDGRDARGHFVALGRPADRRRAGGQHQRRRAEQHADGAPDQLKHPQQVEMRGHGSSLSACGSDQAVGSTLPVLAAEARAGYEPGARKPEATQVLGLTAGRTQRMTIRTSTTVEGAPGGVTLNRNVAPCGRRRARARCTACAAATSPSPAQVAHHSVHTSPRPPQRAQVRRSGTSNGTVTPVERFARRQRHLGRQRDRAVRR